MGKKKKIYKTDLGEFNVPTQWEDITLQQLSELERYYEDKKDNLNILDLVSIFTNRDKAEIEQLPLEVTEKLLSTMAFLGQPIVEKEPTNKITIDGETFVVHNEKQLKTLEAISAQQVLTDDKYDYASLLAIVCRKEGEVYDSHFENEILPARREMWAKTPAVEVKGLISFFLKLWFLRNAPQNLFSQVDTRLDQYARDIESMRNAGDISKSSMRSAMKTLKKLRKSLNTIMQTSSN